MDHRQILLLFSILMTSAALFFTMSRGGMFSFIAALLFIAFLVSTRRSMKNKGWLILAIAVFIVLIIAWLGATPVVERILSFKAEIASRYFGGRLPIWQGTIGIIKDNFIFGTGLGTFNHIFPKYQPVAIVAKHYTYAHSDFFELLSEVGIVGFALFMVCGLWTMTYLFRRFYARHDPWVTGMLICVFGSLASIFIHSFTDFNLHIPANAVLLSVILALFVSILNVNVQCEEAEGMIKSSRAGFNLPYSEAIMHYLIAALAVCLLVIYTIAAVRPAMADHYASIPTLAIRLDPTNAAYHYQLGKATQSIDEYKKAVALNHTNSQYHQSLAWAYGQIENVSQAHQEFEAAIELSPTYYYPYQVYAIWLFNHPTEDNIKTASAKYGAAIKIQPDLAKEFVEKYHGYFKNYEELIAVLPQTEENDHTIFVLLLKDNGLKNAMDLAERLLKSYPHNAAIHFSIADASFYDKTYFWEFTEQHYRITFENDPGNAFYRLWHGIHLYLRRDYKAAIKELEVVLKMNPDPVTAEEAKIHIAKCNTSIQK